MNYLDRNEYNFTPSAEVIEAYKHFDPKTLGFYTRIYDEGKKSIFSVYLAEHYGIDESQVLLGYGGEYLLKQVVHTLCLGTKRCHRHQTEPQKSLHFTPFLILLGTKLRLSERKAKQKTKFFAFAFPNVSNFGEAKVTIK